MSTAVAHPHQQDREHLDNAARAGHVPVGHSFDPSGSSEGQLADVLVSERLKTRGARPPALESEHEFLHSFAQHLLTDPEHILERSIRAAARLCGAGSAGLSLLEADHGQEVFRWVALGGAFEGQEGRATPRFFSPCGLTFDRQAPQLFSYPARHYTCLHGVVPEIVEALVLPLPDGTGTIWMAGHDESIRFDGEHVRLLTGLATFMATSLKVLRLMQRAQRDAPGRDGARPDTTAGRPRHSASPHGRRGCVRGAAGHAAPGDTRRTWRGERSAAGDKESAQRPGGSARPPTSRTAPSTPTGLPEMNEVRLAFRALLEQVRLVLRDGRRLISRLIAACEPSKCRSRVQLTSRPTPRASVPLIVLRPTTDREQIELNGLAQSLSAEGYQVVPRGPQWVVFTEIDDRRESLIGESTEGSRGFAAMSERVRRGLLRQRRRDDNAIVSAAP